LETQTSSHPLSLLGVSLLHPLSSNSSFSTNPPSVRSLTLGGICSPSPIFPALFSSQPRHPPIKASIISGRFLPPLSPLHFSSSPPSPPGDPQTLLRNQTEIFSQPGTFTSPRGLWSNRLKRQRPGPTGRNFLRSEVRELQVGPSS